MSSAARCQQSPAPWSPFAAALAARRDRLRLGDHSENTFRDAEWPTEAPVGPYATYLAGHDRRYRTLALDLDSDGTPAGRAQAERDTRRLRRLLDAAGIGAVETISGPRGGRHLLLTVSDPGLRPEDVAILARRLADLAPSLDLSTLLNPTTGCVRPPGSPHRDGGRSEVVGDAAVALGLLGERNAPAAVHRLARALAGHGRTLRSVPQRSGPSSDAVRGLEQPGTVPARYASGSEAVAALATAYANAGRSEDEFVAFLMITGGSAAGAVYARRTREDGAAQAETWARRTYRAAERFVRAHPAHRPPGSQEPGQGAAVAAAVRAAIPSARLANRERRTLLAFCALAERTGRDVAAFSQRDHAEAAGLTRATLAKARIDLRALRALELVTAAEDEAAGVWRLVHPRMWAVPPTAEAVRGVDSPNPPAPRGGGVRTCGPWLSTPLTSSVVDGMRTLAGDVGHDVWRARGLGETPRRAYEQLVQQLAAGGAGLAVRDLTARLDTCERTTRRALAALASAGLARRDERFRWSPEARDGAEVAEHAGSAGTGDRQRAQHERERLDYRAAQASLRLRRWLTDAPPADRAAPEHIDPLTGEIGEPTPPKSSPSRVPRQPRAPGDGQGQAWAVVA